MTTATDISYVQLARLSRRERQVLSLIGSGLMLSRTLRTAALIVATMAAAACTTAPTPGINPGDPYPRCAGRSLPNADCYGGGPV